MAENNKMDMELDLDALDNISGGIGEPSYMKSRAYCLQCAKEMRYKETRRVPGGGNVTVYECKNVNCTEYGKEKFNGQYRAG